MSKIDFAHIDKYSRFIVVDPDGRGLRDGKPVDDILKSDSHGTIAEAYEVAAWRTRALRELGVSDRKHTVYCYEVTAKYSDAIPVETDDHID